MGEKNNDRGAAVVEFALVLPLLVTIMLGTIEFGFAMYVQASVAGAAREGVRNLAINQSDDMATNAAIGASAPGVNVLAGEVSIDRSGCATSPPGLVYVIINHQYDGLAALSWFVKDGIKITGKGVMRCGG